MSRSRIWVAFLAILIVLTGWFVTGAVTKVNQYFNLSEPVNGALEDWKVEETGSDHFDIFAHYIYLVNDKVYHGEGFIQGFSHRNRSAAISDMKKVGIEGWTVWYAPANPNQSSLGKVFPFKACLYAGILVSLLIYFGWLATRVRKLAAGPSEEE